MQDFNEYLNDNNFSEDKNGNIFDFVKDIAAKYDGKSESELLSAVIEETKKGKAEGRLTNQDIDAFAATLYPFLDDKKKKILNGIINQIKGV